MFIVPEVILTHFETLFILKFTRDMGLQEIIAFAIVLVALIYTGRKFIHQFTHGDEAGGKCAKCELNKAVRSSGK